MLIYTKLDLRLTVSPNLRENSNKGNKINTWEKERTFKYKYPDSQTCLLELGYHYLPPSRSRNSSSSYRIQREREREFLSPKTEKTKTLCKRMPHDEDIREYNVHSLRSLVDYCLFLLIHALNCELCVLCACSSRQWSLLAWSIFTWRPIGRWESCEHDNGNVRVSHEQSVVCVHVVWRELVVFLLLRCHGPPSPR